MQLVYFHQISKLSSSFDLLGFTVVLQRTVMKDQKATCVFFIKFQNCNHLLRFYGGSSKNRRERSKRNFCIFHQILKFPSLFELLWQLLKNRRERLKRKLVYSSPNLKIVTAFWYTLVATKTAVKWMMWKPISVVLSATSCNQSQLKTGAYKNLTTWSEGP